MNRHKSDNESFIRLTDSVRHSEKNTDRQSSGSDSRKFEENAFLKNLKNIFFPRHNENSEANQSDGNAGAAFENSISLSAAPVASPRDLWKNIPTDENILYYKPDSDSAFAEHDGFSVIAASLRGRTHAHQGIPRDDHFEFSRETVNGWSILTVADGAGSQQFALKGSEVACSTVCSECTGKLSNPDHELNRLFSRIDDGSITLPEHTPVLPPEAEKSIHRAGLELLAGAVMLAKDNLAAEAEKYNKEYADDDDFSPVTARDYATTLLIVITRESSQGRLIISFSVGDGVIACCEHGSPGSKDATLHFSTLNEQDCGKYAGETRFITSNSIFKDRQKLSSRLSVRISRETEAVILMTDGISDPFFESERLLHSGSQWLNFWNDLTLCGEDHLELRRLSVKENTEKLLKWLEFYKSGEHDDRTIIIMYRSHAGRNF